MPEAEIDIFESILELLFFTHSGLLISEGNEQNCAQLLVNMSSVVKKKSGVRIEHWH